VQGDVSNLTDLDRLFATVAQQQGRLDILFANANARLGQGNPAAAYAEVWASKAAFARVYEHRHLAARAAADPKAAALLADLAAPRAEHRDQAFRAGQLADCELVAGLLQRGEVMERPLLVGGAAFHGVDNDHGVQVVQHSRPPRRGRAARGVQFPVPVGIFVQARGVFSEQVCGRPPGEAAGALLRRDLSDHVHQAAPCRGRGRTDCHAHGAGRQLWPV
jgi:hypothetical protein